MTHTYVIMEVMSTTFVEIQRELEEAGYQHAILDEGRTLDMHGIALRMWDRKTPHVSRPAPVPDQINAATLRGLIKTAGIVGHEGMSLSVAELEYLAGLDEAYDAACFKEEQLRARLEAERLAGVTLQDEVNALRAQLENKDRQLREASEMYEKLERIAEEAVAIGRRLVDGITERNG